MIRSTTTTTATKKKSRSKKQQMDKNINTSRGDGRIPTEKKRKNYDGRNGADVHMGKIIKLSYLKTLAEEALFKIDTTRRSSSDNWRYALIYDKEDDDVKKVDPSLLMFTIFTHKTLGEKGQNASFKQGGYIDTPQHCGTSLSDFGILVSLQCLRDGFIAITDQMLQLAYNHLRELGLKGKPIHEIQEKYHPDKTLGIDTDDDDYITLMHLIYGFYYNDIHKYETTENDFVNSSTKDTKKKSSNTKTSSSDNKLELEKQKLELEKLKSELEKQKLELEKQKSDDYSLAPPSTPWMLCTTPTPSSLINGLSLPTPLRDIATPDIDFHSSHTGTSSNAMKNLYGISQDDDVEFQMPSSQQSSIGGGDDNQEEEIYMSQEEEICMSQEEKEVAFSLPTLTSSQPCYDDVEEFIQKTNSEVIQGSLYTNDAIMKSLKTSVEYDRYDKFIEELDERKIKFGETEKRAVYGSFLKDPEYLQKMSKARHSKNQIDEIENHLFFADEYLSSIVKVSCGIIPMKKFLSEFFYAEKEPTASNHKEFMKKSEKRNTLIEKNNFGKILIALLSPIEYKREMFNESSKEELFDRINGVYDLKKIGAINTDGSVDFKTLNAHRLKWSSRIVKWMDKMLEDIYKYLHGFYEMFTMERKEKKDFFTGNRKERKQTNINCHSITQILDIIQRLFADTSEGVRAKETFAEYGLYTKFDEDKENGIYANIPDHWCMNRRELYDALNIISTSASIHSAKSNRSQYPEATLRVMSKIYKPGGQHYEGNYTQPNDKRLRRLFE